MRYESAKTEKGNVGISYVSQSLADAQALLIEAGGDKEKARALAKQRGYVF